jgi:hypothetical protein
MGICKRIKNQTMNLSHDEAMNLMDALLEWDSEIGAKELDDNDVGLNFERYSDLMQRLIDFTNTNQKTN